MASKEMTIAIKIGGKLQSTFGKALGGAMKGIQGLNKAVSTASLAAGAATAGLAAKVVDIGSEFEAQMSTVGAISQASSDELEALTAKAEEMGATTSFSAKEAGEAMEYMAMAGWKTNDMVAGIDGIMNLAAASGEDLASTSDIVTDALTGFGLTAADASDFADVLAVASSNANANVAMMGETFKYVAPVVGSFYDSGEEAAEGMRDTAFAVGLMANAGIKASQAGTSFRSILTRLATDAGASSKSLGALGVLQEKLGVQFYDDAGAIRDISDVLMDARSAWAGLSDEEQQNYAKKIAGQNAISGWNAIMNASDGDIRKLSESIQNASGAEGELGAAAEMAQKKLDNLKGDVTLLQSGAEGLANSLYKGMSPMRDVVQYATSQIAVLNNATMSGGFGGFVGAIGGVLADATSKIAENAPRFMDAGVSVITSFANGVQQNLPAIASGMVSTLVNGLQGISTVYPQLLQIGASMVLELGRGIAENAPQILESLVTGISGAANVFLTGIPELLVVGTQIIQSVTTGIGDALPGLIEQGLNALLRFSESLRANFGEFVNAGMDLILKVGDGIIAAIPAIIQTVPTIVTNIAGLINDNAPKLIETGIKLIVNLVSGIVQAIPTLVQNIPQIVQAIISVITAVNWVNLGVTIVKGIAAGIASLASSIPQMFSNLFNGVKNIVTSTNWGALGRGIIATIGNGIKSMITHIPELLKSAGSLAVKAFQSIDWKAVGKAAIQLIGEAISGAGGLLVDAVKGIGGSIIDGVKGIFGGGGGAEEAASSGQAAANSYAEGISQGAAEASAAAAEINAAAFSSMDYSAITSAGADAAAAYSTGMESAFSDFAVPTIDMSSAGIESASSFVNAFDTSMTGLFSDTSQFATAGVASAAAFSDTFNASMTGLISDTSQFAAMGEESAASLTESFMGTLEGFSFPTTEMVDAAALTADMSTAGTEAGAAITSAFSGHVPEISAAGTEAAASLTSAFSGENQGFASAGADAAAAITSAFSSQNAGLAAAGSEAGEVISSAFSEQNPALAAAGTSAAGALMEAFGGKIPGLATQAQAGIDGVSQAFSEGMTTVSSTVTDGMAAASEAVSAGVNSTVPAVQTGATDAANAVSSNAAAMVSSAQGAASRILQIIQDTMQSIVNAIQSVDLSAAGAHMMEGLAGGIRSMQDKVISEAQAVAKQAASAVNTALDIHSPSKVMERSGRFVDEGLAAGIRNSTNVPVRAAAILANSTVEMITGKTAEAQKAGSDITAKISEGISSKAQEASKAASEVSLAAIVDAARKTSDAVKVGEKLAAGIGEGIEKNKDLAAASAQDIGEEVLKKAEEKLKNYKKINDLSMESEAAYWDAARKLAQEGTQARKDIDQKYYEAAKGAREENTRSLAAALESAAGIAAATAQDTASQIKRIYGGVSDDAISTMDKWLSNREVYRGSDLQYETAYWDEMRRMAAKGTQERIDLDKKYFDAKAALRDQEKAQMAQDLVTHAGVDTNASAKDVAANVKQIYGRNIDSGAISTMDKWLSNRNVYEKQDLQFEKEYWNQMRHLAKRGTQERIDLDKKYFDAKEAARKAAKDSGLDAGEKAQKSVTPSVGIWKAKAKYGITKESENAVQNAGKAVAKIAKSDKTTTLKDGSEKDAGSQFGSLLDRMRNAAKGTKEKKDSGTVETLLTRLKDVTQQVKESKRQPEMELAGVGATVSFAPIYNLYGSANESDVKKADAVSQKEFKKLMEQYKREQKRTRF